MCIATGTVCIMNAMNTEKEIILKCITRHKTTFSVSRHFSFLLHEVKKAQHITTYLMFKGIVQSKTQIS